MLHKKIRNALFWVVTIFLVFGYSFLIQAAPVDETEALQIAVKWARILNLPEMKPLATQQVEEIRRIAPTITFTRADRKVAYLFEQKAGGFVLVGADDRLPAILAYSKENDFDPEIPVAGIFLDGLAFELERAEKIGTQRNGQWDFILSARPASYDIAAVDGPLLTTTWNQWPLYNNLCPIDRGVRCPTGCGPTAVAQIMRYHEHPERGTGSNSYTSETHGFNLSADFDTEYDWANMPNELTASSSQTEIDAVAKLCYHVGVAVEVDYDRDSSFSYTNKCVEALTQYFYYKQGQQIWQKDFTNNQWFYIMHDEIRLQRPVFYSIRKADDSGHFVVFDGTDDTGATQLVHINMGWGGYSDGWYAFGAFPEGYDYEHSAVIGIEPDDVANRTHYVDNAGGDDSNDGLSWATAKKTIQASIYSAVDGDDVLVKYGSYNITSPIDFSGANIRLASDDGTHNSYENATKDATQCTIDASGNCGVFYFHNGETSDAVVAGFTIKNGSGEFGGGIECLSSSPTISNNIISTNSSDYGGGIYCQESSPVIEYNTISGNTATNNGGGINCYQADATIVNNTISNNTATTYNGGGIYCSDSSVVIKANIISNNETTNSSGGGIYCSGAPVSIINNLIFKNSATNLYGGGICSTDNAGTLTLTNNTIADNTASYSDATGIITFDTPINMVNTILWNNRIYCADATIDISYSDIEGGQGAISTQGTATVIWGDGNIVDNPLFVDAASDDFHLQADSPCVDAGTSQDAPSDDLDGNPRPLGSGVEIGAYEYGEEIIFGDVSGDETVSAYDAALIFQHIRGLITLSAEQIERGNVDGQDGLTADDAKLILQKVVGF